MYQAVSVTAGKLMDAIVVDTKHVAAECIRCVCVCVCVWRYLHDSLWEYPVFGYEYLHVHQYACKLQASRCSMCDVRYTIVLSNLPFKQSTVVPNQFTSSSHIRYLKDQRVGTCIFLPLDNIANKPVPERLRYALLLLLLNAFMKSIDSIGKR